MQNRVVVTGLGVVSPTGTGWKEFWQGLLEGRSGISSIDAFDTSDYPTHSGGEIKNASLEDHVPLRRPEHAGRASRFALAATKLAIDDAGLSSAEMSGKTVGVCLGAGIGAAQTVEEFDELVILDRRTKLDRDLLCQVPAHAISYAVARALDLKGPNFMFSTACTSGNIAIGYGYDLIRLGKADVIISGASDTLSEIAFAGFSRLSVMAPTKCQPFDKNRTGMMLADGAGILVLESPEHAKERNASVYAEILGYGLSCDAQHMTTPSVEGMSACMRNALRAAGIGPDDVDYICAHGTGTLVGDKTECAAIRKVFAASGRRTPTSSIKSMLGHSMGAASALEAVACALAVRDDVIPPTTNVTVIDPDCDIDCVPNQARRQTVNIAMSNASAFGGNNASLVVGKFVGGEGHAG